MESDEPDDIVYMVPDLPNLSGTTKECQHPVLQTLIPWLSNPQTTPTRKDQVPTTEDRYRSVPLSPLERPRRKYPRDEGEYSQGGVLH